MASYGSPPHGLGQPLVTVSTLHGSGIRPTTGGITPVTTTPAGSNHPLANVTSNAPPPPPPPLPPPPPPPPRSAPPVPLASTAATVAASSFSSPQPHNTVTVPTATIRHHDISPQKKSLESLADSFMAGPSFRLAELKLPPLLKPPPLPPHEAGVVRLRTLVERRAWGDVLQVCGDMLRGNSATSPHAAVYTALVQQLSNETSALSSELLQKETIEIMTIECHAWLKLRRYADLGREVERWTFCRVNDATAVSPAWVPTQLHVLAAASLQYTDADPQRCMDELYSLREYSYDDDNESVLLIDSILSNVFMRQKDWRMALESLDHMMDCLPKIYDGDLLLAHQVEVWSRQGRILLQMGAIEQADQIYGRAEPVKGTPDRWIMSKIPAQIVLNQGLVQFSRQNFNEAMNYFKEASDLLRNVPDQSSRGDMEDWVESKQSLMTQAWNNMGLCALYTCRMKEAVRLMEALVREDPTLYLTEQLAFNLCTLYELGDDTAASARKKRVLQLVAKRFYLHDIGPEQFRVS